VSPFDKSQARRRIDAEKQAQIAALRSTAPLRRPVEQHDESALPLFDAVDQGRLL
jgi:hypothetical protein